MTTFRITALLGFILLGTAKYGVSQEKLWDGFFKDSIVSSLDSARQYFYYYKSTGGENQPLVVSLHQWSSDYSTYKNSLAPETRTKNWNFIRPDFRGPNNHFKACGSGYAIADIDEAIDWAIKNLPVDTARIYVVGASGGGYAALCHFMKSRQKVKEYSVWVPITDLGRWYHESVSRNPKYASDIIKCTCEGCIEYNPDKAVKRSPLYWETPVKKLTGCELKIYAGIHDGYTGAVPIIHSISFYNKIVVDLGGADSNMVSCDEMAWMLTTRASSDKTKGKISDREIHYFKTFKNVSLTIFEGGHEILVDGILTKNIL
jgi:hypothetical protein